MALQHWKSSEFDAAVDAAPLAAVDFWAEWCGPCKMLGPTMEALAEQYEGKALIGKSIGDKVLVEAPAGVLHYEILEITK